MMTYMYMFCCLEKEQCTASKVENSNKSADDSITGKTGDKVSVTCNSDYYADGDDEAECLPSGDFTTVTCKRNTNIYMCMSEYTCIMYVFVCLEKKQCTATKVENSDKSADDSITGKTTDKVLVTCNSDHYGNILLDFFLHAL